MGEARAAVPRLESIALTIRDSSDGDMTAVHAIYALHVRTGTGTFEEVPPDVTAMAERRAAILASDFPYMVATLDDAVVGFAYASTFRPRSAYRFTVEDSIYLDPAATGRGIGGRLLTAVIARCETLGCRQMVAVIGDSTNAASIALHSRLGFRHAGRLTSVGFKFGRWLDAVFMQRPLDGQ